MGKSLISLQFREGRQEHPGAQSRDGRKKGGCCWWEKVFFGPRRRLRASVSTSHSSVAGEGLEVGLKNGVPETWWLKRRGIKTMWGQRRHGILGKEAQVSQGVREIT